MLRYFLDTNIVIYVLKRRPMAALSVFNANANRMAISSITLAELLHGAKKSQRVSENLSAIEGFCSRLDVLPYAAKAAQHYGSVRAALERSGQPIVVSDMHIAGHARSQSLVLVTNNVAEFACVLALEVENWVDTRQRRCDLLGSGVCFLLSIFTCISRMPL